MLQLHLYHFMLLALLVTTSVAAVLVKVAAISFEKVLPFVYMKNKYFIDSKIHEYTESVGASMQEARSTVD